MDRSTVIGRFHPFGRTDVVGISSGNDAPNVVLLLERTNYSCRIVVPAAQLSSDVHVVHLQVELPSKISCCFVPSRALTMKRGGLGLA